jgi:hypothetical protein
MMTMGRWQARSISRVSGKPEAATVFFFYLLVDFKRSLKCSISEMVLCVRLGKS